MDLEPPQHVFSECLQFDGHCAGRNEQRPGGHEGEGDWPPAHVAQIGKVAAGLPGLDEWAK